MKISAIVATDINNAIGKNNQLLWHLPADLKFFKTVTMGCPIIMGRKTYESIGRLLPGRTNIIVSRNSDYSIEGAIIANSLQHAISLAPHQLIFIIGGAEIYKQGLPFISELYRTLVKSSFEADTYFPEIKSTEFQLTWEECHEADEKNKFDYCFQKWERLL